MAQLVRNDSAGVMSSLMMDYGDSDEEESSSLAESRNNSVDDRDKVKAEEEKMEVITNTDDAVVPVVAPIVPVLAEPTESLTAFSRKIEINAAPALPEVEGGKYEDDSPASRVESKLSVMIYIKD